MTPLGISLKGDGADNVSCLCWNIHVLKEVCRLDSLQYAKYRPYDSQQDKKKGCTLALLVKYDFCSVPSDLLAVFLCQS